LSIRLLSGRRLGVDAPRRAVHQLVDRLRCERALEHAVPLLLDAILDREPAAAKAAVPVNPAHARVQVAGLVDRRDLQARLEFVREHFFERSAAHRGGSITSGHADSALAATRRS
jgi:hypothetical protein